MRAFIVRPFGEKGGINFDKVEAELIAPALARLGIAGGTTGQVVEAGNIREDMFQLLLISDLVIADISVDNPNAYYELGIRHALRERRTFLLRAKGMANDVPFDLRTDRYLAYDAANPADAIDGLVAGLKATMTSERQDSPVFRVLPELREQERSRFLPLPREFRDEVEYAAKSRLLGKLALLADETRGSLWESEGLRMVGREQFRVKAFDAATVTLEALRTLDPLDHEANLLLGTIYQRLGNLTQSEVALRRAVADPETPPKDRAEAFSLLGRNLKTRWREGWLACPEASRLRQALQSVLLTQSYDAYLKGFRQDLNHFYSGLNALAMLTIQLELARSMPDDWADRFDSSEEAERALRQLQAQQRLLAGAVEFSIYASKEYVERAGEKDPWVEISLADYRFLTAERPGPVARLYEDALAGQPDFMGDSVRSQIRLYEELGVLSEKVTRVLGVLAPETAAVAPPPTPRTLLFTGHQIDAPSRKERRFPSEKEATARAAIQAAVTRESAVPGGAVGIAGAASGGDILFHEVCLELGVPTRLLLALPPELYVKESVAPAGPDWIRRFWSIQSRFPTAPILARSKELPGWLRHRGSYSIWQRNNLWMLHEALSSGARNLTVLALWDGKEGDGPGGTADMIRIAGERGAETRVLDTNAIFASTGTTEA